ncbi:sulfite exporter TauE/SafE family protein [Larkinella punicea]|uniref:Probable membrane transporter protein n=1 Tax=Larkinella punicea TaxID=2315727 RepID=A0A368JS44_9BACT|nr:sulfite exporter TauE/SafE family protein [Larkinella punicea]RCR69786.1 sulfite exporter TauE/SafE family protein [Larkinella punicea]
MSSHEILGFTASILIGITLGLIGGGGSILTLPVLVYLLGINPTVSTTYSLFVVGTTSLVGAVRYMQQRLVNYRAALAFSLPSFAAIYLTRTYLVPAIPDPVFSTPAFYLSKNVAIMVVFALVMLAASGSMIRDHRIETDADQNRISPNLLATEGVLVGILTGVVGAGGGFLIIPSLVLLARLPIKMAVGTSLLIIAANSLIGFLSGLSLTTIDWRFLLVFTALSILGILLGTYLTRFVSGPKLKKAFGWFVLAMGVYIIVKETFLQ